MNKSKLQYRQAATKYADLLKDNDEVEGIILTGSTIYGEIQKNSDIDVYVILSDSTNYRERGNILVDNIEIEYFKNPVAQIRAYFEQEKGSPHSAHMLANGIILYSNSDIPSILMAEAKDILKNSRSPLSPTQIELLKYKIDDLWKDLEDCHLSNNRLGFEFLKSELLILLFDTIFSIQSMYTPKYKWALKSLTQTDPAFLKILNKTVENNLDELEKFRMATTYVENLLGGSRGLPWSLKSDLSL